VSVLVTGSSGHLGEAIVRTLKERGSGVRGLDITPSPHIDILGSVADRERVRECLADVKSVIHTATLHKPHVETHSKSDFIATNVQGTLNLLEEAVRAGVESFVFTSTTSTFGAALRPAPGSPAVWVTEDLKPVPRNIYGVTKVSAEDLCELNYRQTGLPCVILRTSRFFPEQDDDKRIRDGYEDANAKVNEFLYRRVDLLDVVDAHLLAVEKAREIGFGRYIISATSPFREEDTVLLPTNAPQVVERYFPDYPAEFARRGWKMFPRIGRVYVNEKARDELGWRPRYDFGAVLKLLESDQDHRSEIARIVGSKGYHAEEFGGGRYPVG
jgi:nucleoside-diphosphate-sugar epimerase